MALSIGQLNMGKRSQIISDLADRYSRGNFLPRIIMITENAQAQLKHGQTFRANVPKARAAIFIEENRDQDFLRPNEHIGDARSFPYFHLAWCN